MNRSRDHRQNKSYLEKKNYSDRLFSYQPMDRTGVEEENLSETNSSSMDQENNEEVNPIIKEKSNWLKFKDFDWLTKGLAIGIATTAIISLAAFFLNLYISQRLIEKDIDSISKELANSESDRNNIEEKVTILNSDFTVFRVETEKDFDYIQQFIGLTKTSDN